MWVARRLKPRATHAKAATPGGYPASPLACIRRLCLGSPPQQGLGTVNGGHPICNNRCVQCLREVRV